MHARLFAVALVLSVAAGSSARADVITSIAKAGWTGDRDPKDSSGRAAANATYTLGANSAQAGSTVVNKAAVTNKYSDGSDTLTADTAGTVVLNTRALAHSFMKVDPVDGGGMYPYKMETAANVSVGGLFIGAVFFPSGSASASASDPQYLAGPGIVSEDIGLDVGSAIYAARPGLDSAGTFFSISAPLLADPLATISLVSVSGHVEATVFFNPSSLVTFFDPTTGEAVTAADVEALLEGASGLGTADGLSSHLSLFGYAYDLTGVSLSSDAAISTFSKSDAASAAYVPEPGSWSLLGLGTACCLVYRWRARGLGSFLRSS